MNEIKRHFHKNRAGEYNGKITYSFTHEGKEYTRSTKRHYINAAVVVIRDQPHTSRTGETIIADRVEVPFSSKALTRDSAISQGLHPSWKKSDCKIDVTIYRVADLGRQLQLNEDGKTYTLQGEKDKTWAEQASDLQKKQRKAIKPKLKKIKVVNREHWLTECAKLIESELFQPLGFSLPEKWRTTCGFPSKSGLANKTRTIGQHWNPKASKDKTHEVIVSITLSDPLRVAGVLAHELIHAVHPDDGHGSKFRNLAVAIGLTGKMTATTEGPEFIEKIQPILDCLGPYPHATLDSSNRKKQGTRMIKAECGCCGYTIRLTRKWLEVAIPVCPDPECEEFTLEMEIS